MKKRGAARQPNGVLAKPCGETLSADFIVEIHEHLAREFALHNDPISPVGVRDIGLLEMAVGRQHVGFQGEQKYPTAVLNAASLMYGLCNDHPFHNGNKRTALIAGIMHLDRNALVLDNTSKDDLYDLMTRIASHRMSGSRNEASARPEADEEVDAIARWLSDRVRKIARGERVLTYRRLLDTLRKFSDVEIAEHGFKVSVTRTIASGKKTLFHSGMRKLRYSFSNPGDHRDVSIDKIKEIREALKLTEAHGIDSVAFYDDQTQIDAFIAKNRNVLRLLART